VFNRTATVCWEISLRFNVHFPVKPGLAGVYYAPPLISGSIERWCCLTSVCLTSVAYIGPKSRTERPRKTKIDTEVAHVTRDSNTSFKVKRSRSQGRGILWRPPAYSLFKDYGSGGDNWSYKSCKAPVKSSPSINQHPFYRPDALPAPHHQCQSTEGKISYSMYLLTPTHLGVFQLCLWLLIAAVTVGCCHASHQLCDASSPSVMFF